MTWAGRDASHYAVAALAVGVAIALRAFIDPWLGARQPFVTLYGAVAVAVWVGGYRPGLFAAVLGYLLSNYLFVEPRGVLVLRGAPEVAGLLAYVLSCLLIIGFAEAMHRANTKAVRARRELDGRQQRLVTILEAISDGFYSVDRDWRFVYINAHAERYFGRAKAEMLGKSIWEVYPEAVDSPLHHQLKNALEQQAPVQCEVILPVSQRWYEVRAYPSAEGLSVYFNDVQGRKEAEAALVLAKAEAERRAQDLEEAKNVLEATFDNVPEGITLCGRPPDFPVLMHSRYGRNVLGVAEAVDHGLSAVKAHRGLTLVLSDGKTVPASDELPLHRAARYGEHVENQEFIIRREDGTRTTVLVNAAPVRDRQGEIIGAISCWRDVTQTREVQDKIVAAQHLMQVVADSVPALISYVDCNFRYRVNNRAYETWFGRPRSEFLGRHVREMLGEAAWQSVRPHAEAALRGKASTFESRLHVEEGEPRWIKASFTPDIDDAGNVSGYVAHVTDITESKRVEAALQKRNERLALLWEAAAVLLSTNEPGTMLRHLFDRIAPHLNLDLYFNFMVREGDTDLHLDSCTGVRAEVVDSLRRLALHDSVCGTVAQQRTALVFTDVQHSEDARVRLVKRLGIRAYACNPLVAGDRLLGTLSFGTRTRDAFEPDELDFLRTVSHYVTLAYERLRLTKELREADRRKDEFLSVLAHELRNPLAPLRNGLELIAMSHGDAARVRQAAEIMSRQIGLMVRLIEDLLDVSRITRGKIDLRPERVELAAIVRQAVEAARPNVDMMDHQLEVSLLETPVYLDADPVRLAQVIGNLLNNACKFTERGGRIALSASRRGDTAVISVKDNGVGIPRDKLQSIFDMFVQADPSVERRHGGLGLGLTLVKSLVELHGGTVAAYSEGIGKGSEVVVTLPLSAEQQPALFKDGQSRLRVSAKRVLVVDDSVDSIETLGMLLRIMGHEVCTARSGEEALAVAPHFRPELVLCDIGMPVMSGFEAARKLRDMLGASVTLVALTGYGSEDDRERTRAAGFDLHLVKPVDLERLERALAACGERTAQSV